MTTIGTTEHNESVEVKKSLKDDAHSNEKADSGMDDDSQQSNEQDAQLSDEEEILITKKSKQSKRILDDDSEEEMALVEEDNDTPPNDLQRPESNLPMTTDESMNEAQDNGSGNDSGSDDDEESLSQIINRKKKRIVGVFDDDSTDSVKESEKNASEPSEQNKQLFGNSDLFDAEDDADESLQGEDNPCSNKADNSDSNKADNSDSDKADNSDSGSNSNSSEDEGFNENSIDPKLLAKLKKGAAKKPSRASKAKSRQDEMLDLHSETQRLVRESRVNLPYHQPEPKPLSDFLARASRKQELYRSLHNTRDIHKARIMQETFEKEKVSRQSEREKSQINPSEKVTDTRTNEESVSSEKLESQTENEDAVSENNHEKKSFIENQLGENELPDLEERETEAEKRLGLNDSSQSAEDPTKSVREDGKEENCDSAIQSDNATSNTQCTESIDIKEKQSSERDSEGHAAELVADHTKVKDSKLPFLLEPDLPHLSAVPRLSGGPDAVISLDEGGPDAVISLDEEETGIPQHPGVKKLMGRFMDHSKKRAKHVSKDVSIKIVEKDKDELHMKTFTYHPTQDDENSLQALDVPGAKLMALKEKLQETMKAKREESRKQRQDIYDLDNEEGYVAEDEDAILDDDAEMSEHSDTDVEDDEFDEQFGEDEEMEDEETKEERNPFADDEAEEEDDDDGENLKLHLSDDDDDDAVEDREKNTVDEEGGDLAIQLKSSGKKKKPRVLQISDDEESRDNNMEDRENVTGAEGGVWEDTQANKMEDGSLFKEPDDDLFVPFSKHGTQQVTQAQEMKGSSSFIPPIEDSQDLYGSTPAILSGNDSQPSQSLNFYIEESQSRMFDADGFLRTGSTGKKPKLKPFMSFDTDSSQEHYDELLGLCSGRFQDSESENRKGSCKQQLFGSIANTQNNMDELMGLCSGKFAEGSAKGGKQLFETQAGTQNMEELVGLCSGKFGKSETGGERSQTTGVKRKSPLDEEEENSNDSFKLVSDHEEEDDVNNEKDVFSDDERNEDEDDERSRDSEGSRPEKFTGFTVADKHGKIRREFVEAEAELSGSEYDSDENLDLAEEDDILEMEEGDKDQVGTEEELRNQVGRAHLKQVIDADKRELMRFQEMYLPDGDLHSEGQGRIRRFKWSNMDDDTQQDMFNEDSDGENIEEIDQDSKWRQERYEREKFLQEQEEKDKNEDENSQFLKFGKVFLKRSNSESGPLKKPSVKKIVSKENAPQTVVNTIFKQSMQKKGSFLGRNKETLAKIAELTKSSANPTGPRNSRNFVFQVIAQDKDTNTQDAMPAPSEGKVRKAHKPKQQKPVAKKPRLEKSASFPQNSIFNLM